MTSEELKQKLTSVISAAPGKHLGIDTGDTDGWDEPLRTWSVFIEDGDITWTVSYEGTEPVKYKWDTARDNDKRDLLWALTYDDYIPFGGNMMDWVDKTLSKDGIKKIMSEKIDFYGNLLMVYLKTDDRFCPVDFWVFEKDCEGDIIWSCHEDRKWKCSREWDDISYEDLVRILDKACERDVFSFDGSVLEKF